MASSITCRELIDFLDDYVAGRLEPSAHQTFEQHLGICRHCRDYLATYRQTIALARGAMSNDDSNVTHSMPEDVVQAVLAARKQP